MLSCCFDDSHFDMASSCHPSIKGDIRIVYIVCTEAVRSLPQGEIECMSFHFIYVYVLALTPLLHWSEIPLQIPWNMTLHQ